MEARGWGEDAAAGLTARLWAAYRAIPLQSAPMSSSTSDSRAEARRRARLASRGELPPDEPDDADDQPEQRGGILGRLFPAAPPLPGRPDPLAGFDPSGPMRPVRERFFLLRQGPLIWLGLGLLAFIGYISMRFWAGSILGLIGTFVQFGALIAAGWFGWRRPTLYGTAAGLWAWFLSSAFILYAFSMDGAPIETFGTPLEIAGSFALQAGYWLVLGVLGGWYGGYLRRRQAHLKAETGRRR
jgi:hypothetical protein